MFKLLIILFIIKLYAQTNLFRQIVMMFQKQPFGDVLSKSVLKICSKFTGENPCLKPMQSNFIEITLRHVRSPVNLLHVLGTPFTHFDGCF